MRHLSPEALRHLGRLREGSKSAPPPAEIAGQLIGCGAAISDGRGGLRITAKGREGLRKMEVTQAAPKTYLS